MSLGNSVPDKSLLRTVLQKLMRKGVNSNRIAATVRSGDVTLTGTIDYEHERRSIVNSANSVPGVKRIIDQMRVERKKRT